MQGLVRAGMVAALALATPGCKEDEEPSGIPIDTEGTDGSATSGDDDDDDDDPDDTGTGDSDGDESEDGSSDTGEPMPDPGDPFDPAPPLPTLPDDVVAQIAADIDAVLSGGGVAGTTQTVLVIDAETGQEIYAKNPDTVLKPASNTKLFTSAVAMETLGEDHRFVTEVRVDAAPDADGTIAGDLRLVVHHDFTWSPLFLGPPDLVLDKIAEDLYDLGVRSVTGSAIVHGEAVYDGYQFGTYSASTYRSIVATNLANSLAGVGINVSGGTGTSPDFDESGQVLYTWQSPPLSVANTPLNSISHNEFADILLRHVGWELDGDSSYGGGGSALIDWLSSIPTATESLSVNDGSGLSHDNRFAARTIVDMLAFMLGEPEGLAWVRTFSIAGVRGTLGGRMTGPDTLGRVWGKTGTLTGVIATSGVMFNRHDGRRYLVGILMNDVSNNAAARGAQDDVFEIVARDHWGQPRPAAPVLTSVRAAESDVVEVSWTPVDGATGYLVWLSPDGKVWDRADARLVDGTMHRAGELSIGPDVYVRVTAIGDAGESDPSDVYGSRSQTGAASVLVVDGFDRWQAEPSSDNHLRAAHDFAVAYGTAIDGAAIWDTADNDAVIAGEVDLLDYDAVLWLLGEESTTDETFGPTEQEIVTEFLDVGGSLMVSGAEIGWDLVGNGDPADAAFFTDMLHADYIGDDAESWVVEGLGTSAPITFFTPGTLVASFPDQLAPAPGAESFAEYYGGFGGTAAVTYSGDHDVVLLGFPFETIDNAEDRATVMAAVLDALGV